jgi:hypothetical protein
MVIQLSRPIDDEDAAKSVVSDLDDLKLPDNEASENFPSAVTANGYLIPLILTSLYSLV